MAELIKRENVLEELHALENFASVLAGRFDSIKRLNADLEEENEKLKEENLRLQEKINDLEKNLEINLNSDDGVNLKEIVKGLDSEELKKKIKDVINRIDYYLCS